MMLRMKKIFVLLLCFSILLPYVSAYDFEKEENRSSVYNDINEIYSLKDLYDEFVGVNDNDAVVSRVRELLNIRENMRIRGHLAIQVSKVKAQTREMWDCIWNL